MIAISELAVRQVKGVTAPKESELHAFGIFTVEDLLLYFPFRYEDYRVKELAESEDGQKTTIIAVVRGMPILQRYGRNKSRLTCKVESGGILLTAVWFNRHYVKEQLTPGKEIMITGKWEQSRLQLTVAEHEWISGSAARAHDNFTTGSEEHIVRGGKTDTLQPVYSVGGSLTQSWMRKTISQALKQYAAAIEEILPPPLVSKHQLMDRKTAISLMHLPEDVNAGLQARKRMVYEELFLFQLKIQAFRIIHVKRSTGIAMAIDSQSIRDFAATLPFELTAAQKKVVNELLIDMRRNSPMNRLLQGDVGSGKTVVAAIALYGAYVAGYQGALMVPTEILAEQHLKSLKKLYAGTDIVVELLTGSMTERNKRDIVAGLQMGLIHIVVGTHALIQETVGFKNLGLVVTDEQHRFGVNQRSVLRKKGINPDVLTMTATPIPRTLAITAFGDMDVSTLKEMPYGRKPIKTYWVKHDAFDRVIAFIQKAVNGGRQAYMICPLIEESEKLEVQNAIDMHIQLQQALPDVTIGLLHGRLTAAEKDQVMSSFSSNLLQVVVATTVVEVGVDVPNATVMAIMDAERFGLSQLHQLRGRVGRGSHQSHCILIADPKSETGRMRMKVMTETTDGFEVARKDLELRGPGEFFGTKQSGLPEFRLADLVSDYQLLEEARDDATQLTASEQFWNDNQYTALQLYLKKDEKFQGEQFD
ncbi:ATP-dependent DNA helicase RecG [Paenibacillus yanchengensis]|uniref:ATP-dependent DNA helicase RecG n=1 Tax=Paenibacillus yanchengensis TaxID=2035833 RepID=A0ABW4YMI2_9BACL